MQKFRKKPVEIHAIQFTGTGQSHVDVEDWAAELIRQGKAKHPRSEGSSAFWGDCYGLYIDTLEGRMHAAPGDWVICGVQGEFYPCDDEVLNETYDRVNPLVDAAKATGEAATEFVDACDRAARDARGTR